MSFRDQGMIPVWESDSITINATSNLKQELEITKNRNYNVNYIILDFWFQGATDEPTEAEKLAKLGTWNIDTKGKIGKWKTNLDADDIYYRYLARNNNGHKSFLIGDGGGDDDFHGMRIVLDAGLDAKINNLCAWTPDMEAILKFEFGADSGLDNCELNYTLVGYRGARPKYVASIENKETTPASAGDLVEFPCYNGEFLQEYFAFTTTELNLATIQDTTLFSVRELAYQPKGSKNHSQRLAYVNQMVDGIDDDAEGNLQQYVRYMLDKQFQGFAKPLADTDKITIEAGVSEAQRHYITKLQSLAGGI